MKVIHVPYSFPPDAPGGTEIYVASLASLLQEAGVGTVVCAPGATPSEYIFQGLRVRRFVGAGVVDDASYAYDEGDSVGAAQFDKILDEEMPDVVHLHSFTAMTSVRLARRVRARGIPIVFTYHVPTVSCQRGSMLVWGRLPCDGKLLVDRCTACSLHGKGVPSALAHMAGQVPVGVGKALQKAGLSGGAWTALRMTHLIDTRHASIRAFLDVMDRIVAPSEWVKEVLVTNGVDASKILVCPQGVPSMQKAEANPAPPRAGQGLAMAFFGRLDRTKGLDVVLDALASIRDVDVTLDVYGMIPRANDTYVSELGVRIKKDPRVRLLPAVPSGESVDVMRRYDLLVVPSQWLETGPLVALEAFAAGIPVVGSNLRGIADRVRHDVDGLLVDPHKSVEWARVIRRLAEDRGLLARLKGGIRPPPTMIDVTGTMMQMYRELLARKASAPAAGTPERQSLLQSS